MKKIWKNNTNFFKEVIDILNEIEWIKNSHFLKYFLSLIILIIVITILYFIVLGIWSAILIIITG